MNDDELEKALFEIDGVKFVKIFFENAQSMQMNPNPFLDVYKAAFVGQKYRLMFIPSGWTEVSENTRRVFQWLSNLADWAACKFNDVQKGQIVLCIKKSDDKTITDILDAENSLLFIQKVQKEFQQINPEMFRNLRMLYNSLKVIVQEEIFSKFLKLPGVSVKKEQFDELSKDKIRDKKLFPALNERGSLEFIRMLPEELQDEVTEKAGTVDKLVWFEQKWQEKSCVEEKAFEWLKDLAVDARQTFSDEEEVRYLIREVDINALIDVLISKNALQFIRTVQEKNEEFNQGLDIYLYDFYSSLKDKAQEEIFNKFEKLINEMLGASIEKEKFDERFNGKNEDKELELFPVLKERDNFKFIEMLPEELEKGVKKGIKKGVKKRIIKGVEKKAGTFNELVWFDQDWVKKSGVEEWAFDWLKVIAEWVEQTFSDEEGIKSLIREVDINALTDVLISKNILQFIRTIKEKADPQQSYQAEVLGAIYAALEAKKNQHASESECSIL